MENQKQQKGIKSNESKGNKDLVKISKILKDASKADKVLFELKKMAYQHSGKAVNEFIEKEPDCEGISKLYNTLLEKRAEVLADITIIMTKKY
ncbi:MAG: hypothetical protein K0M40_22735 [Prolixibacteraceae bacterium]|nr:hypothetical protein [Prolixibacteraceae bacterium]